MKVITVFMLSFDIVLYWIWNQSQSSPNWKHTGLMRGSLNVVTTLTYSIDKYPLAMKHCYGKSTNIIYNNNNMYNDVYIYRVEFPMHFFNSLLYIYRGLSFAMFDYLRYSKFRSFIVLGWLGWTTWWWHWRYGSNLGDPKRWVGSSERMTKTCGFSCFFP